jgi:hypothetical protein
MSYKSNHGHTFYCVERKNTRRKEADQRNKDWQTLSLADQLVELDKRFGKNQGAKKQRERITNWINISLTNSPKKEAKHHGNNDSKQSPRVAKNTQGTQESA